MSVRANSYKIRSCAMVFAVFAIFCHAPEEVIFADFALMSEVFGLSVCRLV